MTKENKNRIEQDYYNYQKKLFPTVPDIGIPREVFSDSNTDKLEKTILKFLKYNGHHAVKQHTTGTMIDKRQIVTDVLGRQRQIGSVEWGNTRDEKGRADIIAKIMVNFKGRLIPISVELEVKFGKDTQSDGQKKFQSKIENLGAYYFIIKDFDQFIKWYDGFLLSFH